MFMLEFEHRAEYGSSSITQENQLVSSFIDLCRGVLKTVGGISQQQCILFARASAEVHECYTAQDKSGNYTLYSLTNARNKVRFTESLS